ncbi:SMP-30/gluconolactonase/LRE family protein [Cellulomonas bogoriensis]|nr:SMP-30/gluconolactonase/LRE family protein [Cellulomonas bogoriensis]
MAPMVTSAPEQVTDAITYHGEGPCWSPHWGGLRWVDMLAGDLLTLHEGEVSRLHVGEVAAFVRPRARGGYVVGLERGIGLADDPWSPPGVTHIVWDDPAVRMNEGGCDPAGNLYAGSMAYDATPGAAALYRLTPDLQVTTVLSATISNGIDFSPDGRHAYYNDTGTGGTDVFDHVDGALTNRRLLRHGDIGGPDGLAVDSAGNIWTALNGGGTIRCCAPDGATLAEVEVPVRLVTACAFGGEDLQDLYITTSREHLEDPEPAAGALFRVRVDVPGRAVQPFAG